MALLFGIFMDQQSGSTFESLQLLLDEVNSLYKHRMDELKPQQQKIMDTLAKAWEPISTKQILEQSKLYRSDVKSNQISAQLKLMEDNQLVESVEGPGKNKTYRIRERFFNIWYLMRYGKKYHKEEVLWLVKFLEMWCDTDELKQQIGYQIDASKTSGYSPKVAYLKSLALYYTSEDADNKLVFMESTESFLKRSELTNETAHLIKIKQEELDLKLDRWKEKIEAGYSLTNDDIRGGLSLKSLKYLTTNLMPSISFTTEDLQKILPLLELGIKLSKKDFSNIYAVALLGIDFKVSKQIWLGEVKLQNTLAMMNLANLFWSYEKELEKTQYYYEMAGNLGETEAWLQLGKIYLTYQNEPEKARDFFLKALNLGDFESILLLGFLYDKYLNDKTEAIRYYQKALQLGHKEALLGLGFIYWNDLKNNEKAEHYFLISAKNNNILAFSSLCQIYAELGDFNKMLEFAEKTLDAIRPETDPRILDELFKVHLKNKQYHFLYNQFKKPELELMKYARPYWYVLMWFMKKEYPGEYEKVGSELKETVDEIIQSIEADQRANEGKL